MANPGRHCSCRIPCDHEVWLRFKHAGVRQRVNLSKLYPGDSIDVAAARARDDIKKGVIMRGQRLVPSVTKPTVAFILEKYRAAFPDRPHHYAQALDPICHLVADEVKKHDIKRCVETWLTRPRAGESSARHILTLGKHLFNWAIAEGGLITHTPFRTMQGVPILHVSSSKHRTRRLETGEAEKILAVASGYVGDMFTALIETAARPGELRRLQWRDVHEDHITVVADKAKTKRRRDIPITPTLAKILGSRRNDPNGQALDGDAYVFGDEVGHEIKKRRLNAWWTATCEAANVVGLHLHDLRAEGGSQLLEAGVPVHLVRDALGHTSVSMTNTYLRGRSDALANAYKQRHAQQARKRMKVASAGHTSKIAKSS